VKKLKRKIVKLFAFGSVLALLMSGTLAGMLATVQAKSDHGQDGDFHILGVDNNQLIADEEADQKRFHFFGVANHPFTTDNEDLWNALKTWPNWKDIKPTLKDDLNGTKILTELNKFKGKLKPCDVFIFYYAGHAGSMGKKDPQEEKSIKDPKTGKEIGSANPFDEYIGKKTTAEGTPPAPGDFISDDQLAKKLKEILPKCVTAVVIIDACGGVGFIGGQQDVNTVPNTFVVGLGEEKPDPQQQRCGIFTLGEMLIKGANRSEGSPADKDKNGILTCEEWITYAVTELDKKGEASNWSYTGDEEHRNKPVGVPEFQTIALPVIVIFGLIFLISRRKRKE